MTHEEIEDRLGQLSKDIMLMSATLVVVGDAVKTLQDSMTMIMQAVKNAMDAQKGTVQ